MRVTRRGWGLWMLSVLMLPGVSVGQSAWYQLPGHPIWVDAPRQWNGRADAKAPVLHFQDSHGDRLVLTVHPAAKTLEDGTARRITRLTQEYGVVTWTNKAKPPPRMGKVYVGGQDKGLSLQMAMAGKLVVSMTAFAHPSRITSAAKMGSDLLRSLVASWERPGGRWHAVPGSGLVLREPGGPWTRVATTDSKTLHLARGGGLFRATFTPGATQPAQVMKDFARSMDVPGTPPTTWKRPGAWRPKALRGRLVRGVVQAGEASRTERGRVMVHRVRMWAAATGQGVLLMVATSPGDPAELEAVSKIVSTLAPAPK